MIFQQIKGGIMKILNHNSFYMKILNTNLLYVEYKDGKELFA